LGAQLIAFDTRYVLDRVNWQVCIGGRFQAIAGAHFDEMAASKPSVYP
jgi:hypothetical protein